MKTRTNFFKKIFIISITILFLGGFSLYGYQRAKAVITGPSLILDNKELIKGFTSPSPDITLTGTAKNTAHLSINGENILLSPEGYFSTTLILPEGYSTISLQAEDKFKNIDRELLHIYLPSHDLMKPPDISEIPETPPLTEQEELISTNI